MYHYKLSFLLLCLGFACASTPPAVDDTADAPDWQELIDPELSQWDTYLSFRHQLGYDGSAPVAADGSLIQPIGMNPEGYGVFETMEEEGRTVVRVSGEYYGCLISKAEYANYHLRVQFRWGDKKWVPRQDLLKDSGVLYHSIGPPGAEHWRTWMLSQEFQIMEGHTGDYWNQASSAMD
ncbi:MAG: family 16 glycoside hydrolase, partial [Lewinella sp.]